MSERFQHCLAPPGSVKRRKSLFRRIADSISSFVPSNFFSGNNANVCDVDNANGSVLQRSDVYSRTCVSGSGAPIVRDTDTQTMTVIDSPNTVNVDLDAADISEGEISAHSSTSGVSSLIPRKFATKQSGMKTNVYPVPVSDPADGYVVNSRSATCSDGMDSIASTSTFRPPSITPWILSHGYENSPSKHRPSKRQKISSDHSINSSCEYDRLSLFYRAKTTYGGAASCRSQVRRNGLFEPTTPLRFELEGSSRGSLTNSEPAPTTNLSSTARRILESLERFTTPLATADRVPLPFGTCDSVRSTTTSIKKTFRSHRFPPYMQAYKRLKSLQHEKRELFNHSRTAESTESHHPTLTSSTLVTSLPAPFTIPAPNSVLAVSTQSSAISLPVSNISGFGFQSLPLLKKADTNDSAFSSKVAPISSNVPDTSNSPPKSTVAYTFAPPIRRPPSVANQLVKLPVCQASPKFSFSNPLRSCRSSTALFQSSSSTISYTTFTSNTVSVVSTSSAATCSPIFSLITKPIVDQGSVTSAEDRDPKMVLPTFDLSKSWRCESCLLENPATKTVCSACSMPKIRQQAVPLSSATTLPIITTSNPTQLTKLSTESANRWECPVCMIFNESNAPKCIACGALPASVSAKPATGEKQPAPKPLPVVPETGNKWECQTCMVFNDCDKTACACCQTPKPGAKLPSPPWECPTCMVSNASDKASCPCCATPKPGTLDVVSNSSTASSSTVTNTKFTVPALPTSSFSFGGAPLIKFGLPPATTSSALAFPAATTIASSVALDAKASAATMIEQKQVSTTVSDTPTITITSLPSTFRFGSSTATSTISSTTPTISTSNATALPFSFTQPTASNHTETVPPNTSIPSNASAAPVFTFGMKRPVVSESTTQQSPGTAPVFRFGFSSKLPCTSLANGLVNGGPTVNLFSHSTGSNEEPRISSTQSAGGSNISFNATPAASPKFDFGAVKPLPTVNNAGPRPAFVFGAPFRPVSSAGAATSSSPLSNIQGAGTSTPSVTMNSSISAPFLFGSTQTNLSASVTTSSLFCFGANNQTTSVSEFKPATGLSTAVQPAFFGQNNPPSNLFSANSTSIAARKKAHATRRLHR